MHEKIAISVVMPSFNEEGAIRPMLEAVKIHTSQFETEIVVVDSSTDQTPVIAAAFGARVIRQKPQGHGIALRTALGEAQHDIIITTDCDNTYPMEYIPILVKTIIEGRYDLISCNRLSKKFTRVMPLSNVLANRAFAFLVRTLYRISVHDVSTGMFCMRRSMYQAIAWETNYSFPCEIIVRSNLAGFRYREIDIPYRARIGEVTLHKWRSGKAYLRCIFNYRFSLNINPQKL